MPKIQLFRTSDMERIHRRDKRNDKSAIKERKAGRQIMRKGGN